MGRPARALLVGVAAAVLAGGCGKKGNPLPPLRPVPGRITDLTAHRVNDRVELRFTVPANGDGSTPPAVGRVEIYRAATVLGAAAPSAAQIVAGARDPIAEIRVRQAEDDSASTADQGPPAAAASTAPPLPAAGETATFVDVVDPARVQDAATWSYVVVGVAGRNRRGPVSGAVHVGLAALPEPPTGLAAETTETTLRLTWQVATKGQTVQVLSVGPAAGAQPSVLTPKPLSAAEFAIPVEFGREQCFAVRTVTVAGSTTTEGPLSPVLCTTPVDSYPPPVPSGLQVIQEGAFVTLNWTGVEAADLAGYVVLRGDGDGVTMAPLTRTPVRETTFVDRTVQPGATYTYSVYAVDSAPVPNVSGQSNRQSVTVR